MESSEMQTIDFREALRQALNEEMQRDATVFILGEEVGAYNGAYKVTKGFLEHWGAQRVIDTPICENGFIGLAIGAAMTGLRPVVELMSFNFSFVAADQIISNAAKMHYMSGGRFSVPLVLRGPNGAAAQVSSQHSHCVEALYAHLPGLIVLAPSNPYDAKGLLKSAIRNHNPVLFLESELSYGDKMAIPVTEYLVPIGKAALVKKGSALTLISHGRMAYLCQTLLPVFKQQGIDVELIDLRSIKPLDTAMIVQSVSKTHACLIVEEGHRFAGIAAEVISEIQTHCFEDLEAPVMRVCQRETPMPYSKPLEAETLPNAHRILEAIEELLQKKNKGKSLTLKSLAKQAEQISSEENIASLPVNSSAVCMPKLSPTMEEGQIVKWHKKTGDFVEAGELLFEVATDKATLEYNALDAGWLIAILVEEGAFANVNAPVALMSENKEEFIQKKPVVKKEVAEKSEVKQKEAKIYIEEVLSPMRKTIATRLLESKQTIPHFYLTQHVNAQAMVNFRKQLSVNNIAISYNDIIIRAVALSLKEHPAMNCGFHPVHHTLLRFLQIDVSVAVSVSEGLITPIVFKAETKSLAEIGGEIKALIQKAKEGKLEEQEYIGGSFTVSNLGMYGIDAFTAIINPPQGAILAVGAITDEAKMQLTLSCDHRIIDGAPAALFLRTLKHYLENPTLLTQVQ